MKTTTSNLQDFRDCGLNNLTQVAIDKICLKIKKTIPESWKRMKKDEVDNSGVACKGHMMTSSSYKYKYKRIWA